MVGSARRVVLVADNSKFNEEHFVQFADPGDCDLLLTDGVGPDDVRETYEAAGVQLVEDLLEE